MLFCPASNFSLYSLSITITSLLRRSPSIFGSSSFLRHGTATTISKLLQSHLSLAVFLRTVLVNQTPFRFPTMTSAIVASHMHVNFPSGPPARFLFHKIPSANAMPCTFADLPFNLSYAVFPSRPTSNLVNKNPACSAIHDQMECVASIFTPHRPSMSLRIVLIIPCTDWTALSTIPFAL